MTPRVWSGGIVGLAVALAAYSFATRTPAAPEPERPQWIVVTPENVGGHGIPEGWALVRNGRGLTYWAAPEAWKELERK